MLRALALGSSLLLACVGQPDPPGSGGADGAVGDPDGGGGGGGPDGGGGAPDADTGPEPGDGVDWLDYPAVQSDMNLDWCAELTDIRNHLQESYGDYYWDDDLITAAHETTHGINAHVRNNFNTTGQVANGFYVLGDKAAIIIEPDITKSQVNAYVPVALRGPRYDLYLVGQTAWDDMPLYLWDEWVAYTNGGVAGVSQVNCGKWDAGWRDGVMGPLEFTVYALAVGMAVKALDPDYFADYAQFREFLAWNTRRAMDTYRAGKDLPDFQWDDQEAFHDTLRTDPGAAAMRDFARQTFGTTWADSVLGL
jgi:hypothetical protein